jgi:LPXTG-motif cell wall-anchored protein
MVRRMTPPRKWIVCLIAAAALVAPAGAWAQGAGDEQYQDPFAGDEQSQSDSSQGGGSESAQATPTPAPAAPSQAPAPTPAPAVAAAQQLPRTGNDPITPAVAGFWLLLGGVALRARTRPAE